jgi:hypothetical protein
VKNAPEKYAAQYSLITAKTAPQKAVKNCEKHAYIPMYLFTDVELGLSLLDLGNRC